MLFLWRTSLALSRALCATPCFFASEVRAERMLHVENDRMNRGKPGMAAARECSDGGEPLLAGE